MAQLIQLTKGQFAQVDDEDVNKASQHSWQAVWSSKTKSYRARATITLNSKPYTTYMSRFIMGLIIGDKRQVDHKNHDTLDNRKQNLRVVTNKQNMQNLQNVKGCNWDKSKGKWVAKIYDGKTFNLGYFNTELEAHHAYLNARKVRGWLDV